MMDTRSELEGELFLEVLKSAGQARLAVTGTSMLPSIRPGDVLEVQRQSVADISRGDVVLFARHGSFAAHRVVEKTGGADRAFLVTQGDALRTTDSPVSPEELLGRVTAILRGGRRLDPHLTPWARVASWFLARSEFCARVACRLSRR
jgi:signal peptidase I